jgi:hypothetical protein
LSSSSKTCAKKGSSVFGGKVTLIRNTGDNAHNVYVFIPIVPKKTVRVDGVEGAVGGKTLDEHAVSAGAHHILPGVGGAGKAEEEQISLMIERFHVVPVHPEEGVSPLGLAAGADEHGDGPMPDDNGITDLHSLSDAVLCRLAGLTQEKLMLQ